MEKRNISSRDTFQTSRAFLEEKQNFFSMLVREVCVPLQCIRSALQRNNEQERKKALQALSYISKILDAIAEYEKVESGSPQLEYQSFAVDELLTNCFSEWEETADRYGISFRHNVGMSCQNYYGDAERVIHIIDHIIGNCMIASGEGGHVDVWVSDIAQGDGSSRLVLSIEDNGVPVDNGYFGRAYQLDTWGDKRDWEFLGERPGTIFSLIIVRKLLQSMGGRLKLEHRMDMTNVLVVEIPLNQCLPDIRRDKSEKDINNLLPEYSLLYVNSLIEKEKNRTGIHVVSGGMEALKWLKSTAERIDAVLLETELGDMDFLEFAKKVRSAQQEDICRIPLIVLDAEPSLEMIQEGMRFGINCWLDTLEDTARLGQILKVLRNSDSETDIRK